MFSYYIHTYLQVHKPYNCVHFVDMWIKSKIFFWDLATFTKQWTIFSCKRWITKWSNHAWKCPYMLFCWSCFTYCTWEMLLTNLWEEVQLLDKGIVPNMIIYVLTFFRLPQGSTKQNFMNINWWTFFHNSSHGILQSLKKCEISIFKDFWTHFNQ